MNHGFDGRQITATDAGCLVDQDDWSRELATETASPPAQREL